VIEQLETIYGLKRENYPYSLKISFKVSSKLFSTTLSNEADISENFQPFFIRENFSLVIVPAIV